MSAPLTPPTQDDLSVWQDYSTGLYWVTEDGFRWSERPLPMRDALYNACFIIKTRREIGEQ